MLPAEHPPVTAEDFDPSQPQEDEDVEMHSETVRPPVKISSIEINILIYLYLQESGFTHSAFALLSESNMAQTALYKHFNPTTKPNTKGASGKAAGAANGKSPATTNFGELNGRIPQGELIRKLWKGLRWEEVERHVGSDGKLLPQKCTNQFHLLIPHSCPTNMASSSENPTKPFPTISTDTPPPSHPSDPFPPPAETQPVAGPSSIKRRNEHVANGLNKRRSRKNSDASTTRTRAGDDEEGGTEAAAAVNERPKANRSRKSQPAVTVDEAALASGGKGKAKETDKEGDKGKEKEKEKESLPVPPTATRSRSPAKKDKTKEIPPPSPAPAAEPTPTSDGSNNPRWIQPGDIGLFTEHRDIVNCVAWNISNPDILASSSNDSTARLWELKSSSSPNRRLEMSGDKAMILSHKSMESTKKAIPAVSWHPEGSILATAASDSVGRLFMPNGSLGGILSYGRGPINAIKFSPGGSMVLTATQRHSVHLFTVGGDMSGDRVMGPQMIRSFEQHTDEVNDVDWLDETVFASASNDHKILIWRADDSRDPPRPEFIFKAHTDDVTLIKWAPSSSTNGNDGVASRYLASIADDGKLIVWQMPKYPESRTRSKSTTKSSRSASPLKHGDGSGGGGDDYQFGVIEEGLVVKWQVVDQSENMRMNSLDWSKDRIDGRLLLAAGAQDATIKIYDVISKTCLHALSGFEGGTGSLSFSPAGFRGTHGAIAGGAWNASFRVWDVETGEVLKEYEMEEEVTKRNKRDRPFITSTAWRPDGQHVAVGLHNKSVMTFYVGDLARAAPALPTSSSAGQGQAEGAKTETEKVEEKVDLAAEQGEDVEMK